MKKIITIIITLALVAAFAVTMVACGNDLKDANEVQIPALEGMSNPTYSGVDFSTVKIGLICLHDESSTYDLNFINATKAAVKALGMNEKTQLIIKTNIDEDEICYTTAKDLVLKGCNVIFADSFNHESYMLRAASEHPTVQFCHATGVQANGSDVANFHNAFASIYQGRYLAGIAAGLKLKEMIDAGKFTAAQAKIGYVGAFTYAEVISGYTSFYLGAKSIVPEVTMDVQFTGSWYSVVDEKEAAKSLIANGCKLISQHADSMGAPSACEAAGVPNVSYNGSTISACPNTFIVSSRIDWTPYVKYIIAQTAKGEAIVDDYVGTLLDGSVALTGVNGDVMAEGTIDAIVAARAKLVSGELEVFDTAKFTVGGNRITSKTVAGREVVVDGIFKESWAVSAPYFDYNIDGITRLNEKF